MLKAWIWREREIAWTDLETNTDTDFQQARSRGPMARRLTTNQKILGSIPSVINLFVLHQDSVLQVYFYFTIQVVLNILHPFIFSDIYNNSRSLNN